MNNPDRTRFAKVYLADLYARAADRPAGYAAEVIALATDRDDEALLIPRVSYSWLVDKYSPPDVATAYASAAAVQAVPRRSGPELWAMLHTATEPTPDLLAEVRAELPPGCGCLAEFDAMLARTPPVFSPLSDWRAWVTDRHNEVNARLGKPLFTYAESDARWPL